MKKLFEVKVGIITITYLLLFHSNINSQVMVTPGGVVGSSINSNVGIGTNNSPSEKLDVNGNILLRNFSNVSNAGAYIHFSSYSDEHPGPKIRSSLSYASGSISKSKLILSSYWEGYKDEITLMNGKVGIGTSAPSWNLTVDGCTALSGSRNQIFHLRPNSGYAGYIYWAENNVAERGILGFNAGSGDLVYRSGAYDFNNGTERFRVTSTGNFLIGKDNQTNTSYKLDIAGKIRADEVVVNTTGADFVFEPTYKLRSLSELETFIRTNKHLPDIAPAKEMQENGVSAGEMQAKLLQKVEELTLYVIEKDKEIAKLKAEKDNQLAEQQKLLLELKKEIEILKNK